MILYTSKESHRINGYFLFTNNILTWEREGKQTGFSSQHALTLSRSLPPSRLLFRSASIYLCNGYSFDPIAAQSRNTGMGTPYSHRGSGLSEGSEKGQAGDVVGVAEGPVTRRSNTRCKQTSEGQTKGESKAGRKLRSRCRDTPNSPGERQTETRSYGTKVVVGDRRLR